MSCHCQDYACKEKEQNNNREENNNLKLVLYIISLLVFGLTFSPFIPDYIKIAMYVITILFAGYEIIYEGIKNIIKLNFKEDTLMTIAIIAACILGEFIEGCLVIILFKLGEFIEEKAISKSNKSIESIVDIKSKNANLVINGEIKIVDSEILKIGEMILIKPGEKVPVDCKVILGKSHLDTSSITGESMPVSVKEGNEILSGSINLNGSITCKVIRDYKNSTAAQIVDLVYEAQNNKGKTEKFITKFSRIYTPIVLILAVLIGIAPTILGYDFRIWVMRALVFLVASCPCSIVISIPLALYSCIGAISKKGMLVKGTKHIENLAKTKIFAFDKTGTITTGKMKISKIELLDKMEENKVLEYLYNLERNSSHPIATAIENKIEELNIKEDIEINELQDYEEIAGYGIVAKMNERKVFFGNYKLLEKYEIKGKSVKKEGNYLVIDDKIIACITLSEEIRKGVNTLIEELAKIGIRKTVMLTGDNEKNAYHIAEKVGIKEIYAGLLPKDKLEKVELLKKDNKVTFIGDGINDSPVLAKADFSISIGEGTEIANNTADSILISNNLNTITDIIKTTRKTMNILKFNIIFSLFIKGIVLISGVLGYAPIWLAVFADVGVTLLTVLNSIRIK